MHKTVEVRQRENFNKAEFLRDLRMIDWNRVTIITKWDVGVLETPVSECCLISMHHSELKRVKNERSPWITNELLREIHKRDFLKQKAASTNDNSCIYKWKQFKDARNKASNSVKKAKRKHFSENLESNKSDSRKTWRLINELQSRQSKSNKVSQVKTGK